MYPLYMVLHSYIHISSNWEKFYFITWKELLADSLRFNGKILRPYNKYWRQGDSSLFTGIYGICYAKYLSLWVML